MTRGRNLAIANSFYLQFKNNTAADVPLSLFTLGSSSVSGFTTGPYAAVNNQLLNTISYGVWNINSLVVITDQYAQVISSVTMTVGSTIAQYMALVNPLIDSAGNVGSISIQQNPLDTTGKFYDIVVTGLGNVTFSSGGDGPFSLTAQTSTYLNTNPFITVQSTVPLGDILQSEIANSYRILGIDLLSTTREQLIVPMSFGRIDSNGNAYSYPLVPVVDPYQYNRRSIHAVDAYGLILDPQATFTYVVLAGAIVRLTFNYMKACVKNIEQFDGVFTQMLAMKFAEERLALKLEAGPRTLYTQ